MPKINWNDLGRQAKENSGGSFVKISTDENNPTVFTPRGDAHVFYQNFQTKEESELPAQGFAWKFKVNVAVFEGGRWQNKILNGGATLATQLHTHIKKWPQGHCFTVYKTGSGKETKTHMVYGNPLSANDELQINALKTLPLGKSEPVAFPEEREPGGDDGPY